MQVGPTRPYAVSIQRTKERVIRIHGISWNTRDALFVAISSLPALGVIVMGHAETGLQLLMGILPAAAGTGLAPTRKARLRLSFVGLLFAVFILLGSFAANWAWLAVLTLGGLGYGAAWLTTKTSLGNIVLLLGVPLAGIGLSYQGITHSIGLATLLVIGSIFATLVSMFFPVWEAPKRPEAAHMPVGMARDYGLRLGLAGATATALGFGLGVDHIGWIVGSTLLVMRPGREMVRFRAVGRIASIFVGALLASLLLSWQVGNIWVAVIAGTGLILAGATRQSRWYITPGFMTFVVFWVLLYGEATPTNLAHRFWQRVLEAAAGISIALFFGVVWPTLVAHTKAK